MNDLFADERIFELANSKIMKVEHSKCPKGGFKLMRSVIDS